MRLPRATNVRVEGSELQLATVAEAGGAAIMSSPEDAMWTDRDDYARSIAAAVLHWFEKHRIAVRVEIATAPGERAYPGRIPLASNQAVDVAPAGNADRRWHDLLDRVEKYVARQNQLFLAEEEFRAEGAVIASPKSRAAHRLVVDAARRGLPLMLIGPSGAGKEGLARCYHRNGARNGPFVARNCALLSRELSRVELFGAEAGAYTGCLRTVLGAVEKAAGGSLFLDEIGEMPLELQPMLLRFLDSGEYERIGAYGDMRKTDVRIVAASNRDLRAECRSGRFRTDLWYRLSVQVVELAPLRERTEDVEAYLRMRSLDRVTAYESLDAGAIDVLRHHGWEGNYRELGNFVAQLPHEAEASSVTADHCKRLLARLSIAAPTPPAPRVAPIGSSRWSELAVRAIDAFSQDHDGREPASWDDLKIYVEKYWKPILFAHLCGLDQLDRKRDLRELSDRIGADRGTAAKQLARYTERFGEWRTAGDVVPPSGDQPTSDSLLCRRTSAPPAHTTT